jgi:hypothetical protein
MKVYTALPVNVYRVFTRFYRKPALPNPHGYLDNHRSLAIR